MAVRVAPGMMCARKPSDSTTRTTLSTSPLPAWAFITMSMAGNGVYRNYRVRSNLTHAFRFRFDQNRRQRVLDLGPMFFVLRRELQTFAEIFGRLVHGESRSVSCNFKQNSARFAKIDGVKIKSVDDRRHM